MRPEHCQTEPMRIQIYYIVYAFDAYTKLQKGIQGFRAGTEQLGAPKVLSLLST